MKYFTPPQIFICLFGSLMADMNGQIEQNPQIEEGTINTLIYSIIKHFIGDANMGIYVSFFT